MPAKWQYLSPQQFAQLQEYASYSTKKVKDVLSEFSSGGKLSDYDPEKPIDYKGFLLFMSTYLEAKVPEDLCRSLFISFLKRPGLQTAAGMPPGLAPPAQVGPEGTSNATALAVAGHTACAAITASASQQDLRRSSATLGAVGSTTGSARQSSTLPAGASPRHQAGGGGGLLASLTERLHHLGHHGSNEMKMAAAGPRRATGGGRESDVWQPLSTAIGSGSGGGHESSQSGSTTDNTKMANELVEKGSVELKDLMCYLSLLESGRPEDKLEFMFRLYDTDDNGYLDASEVDCIISQMMNVAEYLGWDITELEPILKEMMAEIDYDSDGTVSLEEWKRGGLTNIPLLVLLGLEPSVKDDGSHFWRMKQFARPTYCNKCYGMLVSFGTQGLSCVFCKYTVHERCVRFSDKTIPCIHTYTKSRKALKPMQHHWIPILYPQKCSKCKTKIKNVLDGHHCRWCQTTVDKNCMAAIRDTDCDLGELREHILPPTAIFPAVLERKSTAKKISDGNGSTMEIGEASTPLGAAMPTAPSSSQLQNFDNQTSNFQICLDADQHPLLVFINPKSGGKQGVRVLSKLQYLLNPRQVYDIMRENGPMNGLQFFRDVKGFRLLVCGGDGTIGWLLEAMDKFDWGDSRPPVAILPLGTGNDLARCLRWGGGYEGESLIKILSKISMGTVVMMDRWQVEFSDPQPVEGEDGTEECKGDEIPCNIINNYFSIGVDASIAHRFHVMREKHPEKFSSRMRNRMFYMEVGTTEILEATCKNLHEHIDIMCDGYQLDLSHGTPLEGIALLNIPSVYGGSTLWGQSVGHKKRKKNAKKKKKKEREREVSSSSLSSQDLACAIQDMGDQLIEVVGLDNALHAGMVAGGLRSSGKRLAQCSEVVIRTRKRFPMQIDGEPWLQPPCTISITLKNQVPMIMGPPSTRRSGLLGFFSRR